jgi:hypothetical protein
MNRTPFATESQNRPCAGLCATAVPAERALHAAGCDARPIGGGPVCRHSRLSLRERTSFRGAKGDYVCHDRPTRPWHTWQGSVLRLLAIFFIAIPGSVIAQPLDSAALRRKQDDQEKARAMTRALLDGILTVQLRQLEDNGLTDLPAYREITAMRSHLSTIVDDEMSQVVAQLALAQSGTPAERDAEFVAARKMVRDVVTKLAAERQGLLKRLKVAQLAEQVHRLVTLQTRTIETTESIAGEAKTQQETLALAVQEDQRDVKELFLHLVETLTDVQTWGGAAATTAVDGLRVLKAADVGRHVDGAVMQLAATEFDAAVEHQTGVVRGLDELLRLIQRNQGLLAGEHRDALARLKSLVERQQQVRDETRRLPTQSEPAPELVDRQVQLRKDLAEFAQSLPPNPAAQPFAEQAQAAADNAAKQLFDGHTPEAVEQQNQVLGNLGALEEALVRAAADPRADRTAAELAATVKQLETTKAKLQTAADKQQQSHTAAQTDAAKAKTTEAEIAAEVTAAKDAVELADATEALLGEAATAVQSAAEALANASGPATESQQQAMKQADKALDRAIAAIDADLQEARRMADAVKIGELARAAEALERAAAEEREIVGRLDKATKQETTPAAMAALNERQADVAAIAAKVSEALRDVAPAAAESIAHAAEQAAAARALLESAAKEQTSPTDAAKSALAPAKAAAEQLAKSASELRQIVQQAAQELADRSTQQAEQLNDAAEQVERAQSPESMSLVDRLAQLQQARQQTDAAVREQQRASGRPEAAAGLELAAELAAAQALQQAANRAAAAYERGESPTVLSATTAQQAAADAVQSLSENDAAQRAMPAEVQSLVEKAAAASTQAAKQMLDGRTEAAASSRQTAMQALESARQQIAAGANQAMQAAPTAAPDAVAQRKATEAATGAEQSARSVAPTTADLLKGTRDAGEQAAKLLDDQQPAAAQREQQRAEETLSLAQRQLDEAMDQIRVAQAKSMAQQAEAIGELVKPTAPLESGAAAALEAAERMARASTQPNATADEQMAAAQAAERQLQRAAATLSAKSQQLRRDQAVAEALSSLAEEQQAAAATLAEQRNQAMGENAAGVDAAQARAAAEKFTEAQRATGQGAAELSGQQQVANQPLREALQMAAELAAARLAAALTDAEMADHPEVGPMTNDPAQPATSGSDAEPVADTGQTPSPNQPGKTSPSNRPPTSPPADDTGFVPQSPELTAQMMAGPELNQAMQAADQTPGQAKPSDGKASQRQQAQLDTNSAAQPSANQSASTANQAEMQAAKPGGQTKNEAVKDGQAQKQQEGTKIEDHGAGQRVGDADANGRAFEDQPWFAKLPQELRKSIRAGAQQKAPKAYEDRLRRYFQSVE